MRFGRVRFLQKLFDLPPHAPRESVDVVRQGQTGSALVSWIGWKGVPCLLWYCVMSPVWESVTVMITSTLVRPPAKNQYLLLSPQPLSTFTTASTLSEEKNHM